MALSQTELKTAIKDKLTSLVNSQKATYSYPQYKSQNGELVIKETSTASQLPSDKSSPTGDAMDLFMSDIAEAVATSVVEHLNQKLVNVVVASFTPLVGTGGGVLGPVVIPPQPITFTLTPGNLTS